jgi:hypothetical protein
MLLPFFHAFRISRDPESAHNRQRRVAIGLLDAVTVVELLSPKARVWTSAWAAMVGIMGVALRVQRGGNWGADAGIAGLAGSVFAVEVSRRNSSTI